MLNSRVVIYMDSTVISPSLAIGICSSVSCAFVASLYMWKGAATTRNDPSMIKKRTVSVASVCLIGFVVLYWLLNDDFTTFLANIGFRTEGIVLAVLLPLLHTMILFAGPLTLLMMEGELIETFNVFGVHPDHKLMNLRDYLIAPLFEELAFRSIILNVLCNAFCPAESSGGDCFSRCPTSVMFGAPLFFGVAHLHHAYERVRQGESVKRALAACCFQLAYTTVFGAYVSFVFVRTQHIVAIVLVHSFCNVMGFPDVQAAFNLTPSRRNVTLFMFVVGLVLWCFTFEIFLSYSLYHTPRVFA